MCCPVMACLSCFFVVVLFCFLCYSMCSNHCGDLEVAPLLSFVVCVCVCVCPRQEPQRWEALVVHHVVISACIIALSHHRHATFHGP